jgi:putative transposase
MLRRFVTTSSGVRAAAALTPQWQAGATTWRPLAYRQGPCSEARPLSPWGFRGRRGEPDWAVFLVDGPTNCLKRLAFRLHRHHVTRDVQADVSPCTVVGKCNGPVRKAFGHIAIGVMPVANCPAAAHARDILQRLAMLYRIVVNRLDLRPACSGERRKLPSGHRLEQVATWRFPLRRLSPGRTPPRQGATERRHAKPEAHLCKKSSTRHAICHRVPSTSLHPGWPRKRPHSGLSSTLVSAITFSSSKRESAPYSLFRRIHRCSSSRSLLSSPPAVRFLLNDTPSTHWKVKGKAWLGLCHGIVNLSSRLSNARLVCDTHHMNTPSTHRYRNHRFPAEIISHGVWLYFPFCLSYRDVEELLFAHVIIVTYEAMREWCRKFGQQYANQLRRRRPRPGDTWHLDEVFRSVRKLPPAHPPTGTADARLQVVRTRPVVSGGLWPYCPSVSPTPASVLCLGLPAGNVARIRHLAGTHHRHHRSVRVKTRGSHALSCLVIMLICN